MRLISGDLVLEELTYKYLFLVREWRNAEHVRNNLLRQDLITEEQQIKWFNAINNSSELYFVIIKNKVPVGLIYVNNILYDERAFEGNIFIGEKSYLNSPVSIRAIMMISDLFFRVFDFSCAYSKVLNKNLDAIKLDEALGYKFFKTMHTYDIYRCIKDDYLLSSRKLRQIFFSRNKNMEISIHDKSFADKEIFSKISQHIPSSANVNLDMSGVD